jgi:two-component SAPR family response regulator
VDRTTWRIELFGGLNILKDGVPTAQGVASRVTTTNLLALLTLNKGRWSDADTLAAKLWPGKWEPLVNLHAAFSRLKGALGDDGKGIIVRQGRLYRIDTGKVTTDVADIDRLTRKVTFAEGIDDGIAEALHEIEGLYKGDLLGRGDACRNQTLLAHNREYRQKMLGVWEVAARLYLERGGPASKVQAQWYIGNLRRLQGQEAIDGRAVASREMLGEPVLGRQTKGPLLGTGRRERDDPGTLAGLRSSRGREREGAWER